MISRGDYESHPAFSPRGDTLYMSNRPINPQDSGKEDTDIWMTAQEGGKWHKPVRMDAPENSMGDECYPTLSEKTAAQSGQIT